MIIRNVLFVVISLPLGLFATPLAAAIDAFDRQPPSLQLQLLDELGTYKLTVVNEQISWEGKLIIRPDEPFCKELEAGFSFCGRLAKNGEVFHGYFQSGVLQYSFRLQKDESGKLVGAWQNLAGYDSPKAAALRKSHGQLAGYNVPY